MINMQIIMELNTRIYLKDNNNFNLMRMTLNKKIKDDKYRK